MKARHFKKLRAKTQWYDVESTIGLFGRFEWNWNGAIRVLATCPLQACYRARRRGYSITKRIKSSSTTENWACWRVKLSSKSKNFRNIYYY